MNDDSRPHPPEAARISARLSAVVRDEIDRAGGWIRFSTFMALALYAPGLGYYSAGATKLGRDARDGSDFVTAPELTPLFARALARPVADVLAAGGDTVLELGGGTGRLAADLLDELERLDRLPARYRLLDVSADLRERQRATLVASVPHLVDRVDWPSALPDRIHGVVVGNEVLDALPVDLVVRGDDGWTARGVAVTPTGFGFADRPLPNDLRARVAALDARGPLAAGYTTEIALAADGLVASLVSRLSSDSVALFVDYGFPGSEYYHPQRASGTLMMHREHRATIDPFEALGLQDITAHVDFSAAARAAQEAGGTVVGYTSQSSFLLDCGIATLLEGTPDDPRIWLPQASALNLLLSPAEMGELFKVVAFGRRPWRLPGFRTSDRAAAL